MFEHNNGASHIWRGIVNGFLALKGVRWRLENGRKINFWMDPRAYEKPLLEHARGTVPNDILVREFWLIGWGWDWLRFNFLLPASAPVTLTGFMVSEDENKEHGRMWGNEAIEEFTVSKAYKKFCATTSEATVRNHLRNKVARLEFDLEVEDTIEGEDIHLVVGSGQTDHESG